MKSLLLSACSHVILPIFSQISHPREGLVSTFIHDLQVTHLEPTNREIWNFKLYVYRILLIFVSVRRLYRWQLELSVHYVLTKSGEGVTDVLGKILSTI